MRRYIKSLVLKGDLYRLWSSGFSLDPLSGGSWSLHFSNFPFHADKYLVLAGRYCPFR